MEIRTLCDIKIRDFAASKNIPVAYENVKTSNTGSYLEPFLLPANNLSETFEKERESGIYQINVYVPLDIGPKVADGLASEIMALFKTGTYTGDYIHLPAAGRSGGYKTETHYCVAISINYMRLKK